MKTLSYTILTVLFAGTLAIAGFQHPIEESGADALAIQNTPIHPGISSSKRMMPDRAVSSRPPNSVTAKSAPAQRAPAQELPGPPLSAKGYQRPNPQRGPLPQSPALPATVRFAIPSPQIPTNLGDGLLTMKPQGLALKGSNRAQIYSFLHHARSLTVPVHAFSTDVRALGIAKQYQAALSPTPYHSFRTAYRLSIAKIGKIPAPPVIASYENMVKRIDSLFLGLELHYPKAVLGLWQLAESASNPRSFQARDALFAGILSERAGWEAPASLLLAESAVKRADLEERYLRLLWNQLETVKNPSHIENIVAKVNPHRVREISPEGDKANFAMAKRMVFERPRPPFALNPPPDSFMQNIHGAALRDRFSLLTLLGMIRSPRESKRKEAMESLKKLEAEGDPGVKQESRLALARGLLQSGASGQALELYKTVEKNGKNRLEVLAEQTYAEYMSGNFQDSLGKTIAMESPYFRYGFAPDVHLVEILSRKALCDFGGAEAGVQRLADRYRRELAALENTLAIQQHRTALAYYDELVSYHALEQPLRYQRFLLQLSPVMENQKTMNQALGDLKNIADLGIRHKLPERPAGWDAFAASMQERWGSRAKELRAHSAETAIQEMAYMAKRLRHTFAQVELLDLDISTSAAKTYNLQSALNFPAHSPVEAEADIEKLRWPFENEIWADEIDFMKAKNPTKCAVASAL